MGSGTSGGTRRRGIGTAETASTTIEISASSALPLFEKALEVDAVPLAPEGQVDANELTRKADIALYEAKANGRNRAVIYEEVMDELVQAATAPVPSQSRCSTRRGWRGCAPRAPWTPCRRRSTRDCSTRSPVTGFPPSTVEPTTRAPEVSDRSARPSRSGPGR